MARHDVCVFLIMESGLFFCQPLHSLRGLLVSQDCDYKANVKQALFERFWIFVLKLGLKEKKTFVRLIASSTSKSSI